MSTDCFANGLARTLSGAWLQHGGSGIRSKNAAQKNSKATNAMTSVLAPMHVVNDDAFLGARKLKPAPLLQATFCVFIAALPMLVHRRR